MTIERHLSGPDRKEIEKEQVEDLRIDDAFSVIDDDPSDPHFSKARPRPDKFTVDELEVASKFKEGKLSEEDIMKGFEKAGDLKEGNPRLEFLAGVMNKYLAKKAWYKITEKRREELEDEG